MSEQNPGDPGVKERIRAKVSKPKLQPPPMYRVLLFNDDFTPMEFVVHVLMTMFNMDEDKATYLMLMVHTQGQAVIGIYTRDIAESLSSEVNEYARSKNYPLLSGVEKVD